MFSSWHERLPSPVHGRGAQSGAAPQRFGLAAREPDGDWLDTREAVDGEPAKLRTTVTEEHPRTIVTFNRSPDLPFDRSINAYRGCEHVINYTEGALPPILRWIADHARVKPLPMRRVIPLIVVLLANASPVHAQSEVEKGFAGALRGCEEWILNPASWAEGIGPFVSTVGLGDKMGLVETVADASLPPKELRKGNHYWRINSTEGAGYVLVVSDQLPMCHITGGGNTDLQPAVEAVIASESFDNRWKQVSSRSKGDMMTTTFQNREEPALSITISRAKQPGQRLDRVQVLATATHAIGS